MMWLDLFLSCYVQGLAWCFAVATVLGVGAVVFYAAFAVYLRMPLPRDRK